MKTTLLSLSTAAILLGTTAVEAKPIYLDVGDEYGSFGTKAAGATTTGWVNKILYTYRSTTFITDANGDGNVNAGDTTIGTGGLLNDAQFDVGSDDININYVTGFSPGANSEQGPSDNGYEAPNWLLSLGWNDLAGTVNETGDIDYHSGTIRFYLFTDFDSDNSVETGLEVLNIAVQSGGSNAIGQSLNLSGIVDYANLDIAEQLSDSSSSSTIGGLFNFDNGSFGDLSEAGVEITAHSGQDTSPFWFNGERQNSGYLDLSSMNYEDGVDGQFILSGEHDGSISFVPEPTSIALLGIGLLGLGGAVARRRKSA